MSELLRTDIDAETGEEYLVYSDGFQQWKKSGKIKAVAPSGMITTSERGRELIQRRVSLSRQRAVEGLTEGLGLPMERASSGEAWREATKILAERFRESRNVRGMSETYVALGKATGYMAPDDEDEVARDTAALMGKLIDFLESRLPKRNDEVISGEVLDE